MKWKKLVSVILVGSMAAALLAGCSDSSDSESASEEETEAEETVEAEEAEEAEEEEVADVSDAGNGEIVEIEVVTASFTGGSGVQEVEDAVNEISEAEIGVHINLNTIDVGAYDSQLSLMFAGGDTMDLLFTLPSSGSGFSNMVSQNQLTPLNDLLPEYAPDAYAMVEDYLEGTTVNGNIYGVTGYRLLNSNAYYVMRKDVLEDLGLTEDAENASSWSDIEAILQAVKDSDFDDDKVANAAGGTSLAGVITPEYMLAGPDDWSEAFGFDSLGDTYRIIAVDPDTSSVYCYYTSEEYYEMISRVSDWNEKGLVYKDAAISQEDIQQLLGSGVIFSYMLDSEIGIEGTTKANTGYEAVCAEVTQIPLSTSSVTKMDWVVPVSSSEPEAAMKFLNLMFTNADVENLLAWGIEGRDYELNEEGEAVMLDGAEYMSADYMWGNQFLAYPAEGQGGDFRETSMAEFELAEVSPYFGFNVDTAEITNDLTAVSNVITQYSAGYEAGSTPPPATYEEYLEGDFVTSLEEAGLQTVLDYYQDALDEWLASK